MNKEAHSNMTVCRPTDQSVYIQEDQLRGGDSMEQELNQKNSRVAIRLTHHPAESMDGNDLLSQSTPLIQDPLANMLKTSPDDSPTVNRMIG